MPHKLSVSEQLTFSTVRIECALHAGGVSCGTGFFLRCLEDAESHYPVIVTNKHVVKGAARGRFHLTLADKAGGSPLVGRHVCLELDQFEQRWIMHPDPNVDVCMMPIGDLHNKAVESGQPFFYIGLNKSLFPTREELADLGALEDVIMIGYPNGIWDAVNNMPIVRRGVTATHPNLDYEGRKEFMIDAACFPGSSGSPVFLYNAGGWANRSGTMVVGGTRVKLLGLLYAGPQHTTEGEIKVVAIPTNQKAIAVSSIPNNLGMVIKTERLAEMDDVIRPLLEPRGMGA